jgi:hypothetical protein
MKTIQKTIVCVCLFAAMSGQTKAIDVNYKLSLKQPGNAAVSYDLKQSGGQLKADSPLPVVITQSVAKEGALNKLTVTLQARQRIWFNLGMTMPTGFATDDCEFYLPGFWYHKNLRSPESAPSFHTSKSWNFREDRLSAPLTGVFDTQSKQAFVVMRQLDSAAEALTTHQEGEVLLGGRTSLGYLGFDQNDKLTGSKSVAELTFGYPYVETPRRYIRKLTLANPITTFARLEAGESITLTWLISESQPADYGQFVMETWQLAFDQLSPRPLTPLYTPDQVKAQLANYFRQSYVDKYDLKYHSGVSLRCDDCLPTDHVQLGFCGRVLLNAFNSLEYGEQTGEQRLVAMGREIFDSWLQHGFTAKGYFKDEMHIAQGIPADADVVHSIRQQSEAVYAVLHYLNYEKQHGRKHQLWEQKVRTLLNNMLELQKSDGHFPRKYRDDHSDVDASGGSTPSATSTLVMGYRYFGDKRYLKAAKLSVDYLEKNIISKSDYFSSTLDANCEDKEAAISAVTATYYLAMVSKKAQERSHYIALCRQASYFALSWYYLWDVPFAQGQMLGDLGFKSRGWSNVSVENNHVDVFVFELAHIVKWLAGETGEHRFAQMHDLIASSLCQLLPTEERLCGIAIPGFNPEVVQHTYWDYGKNGKGYYNDIFAPGWTIASLWELYSPRRTADFLR